MDKAAGFPTKTPADFDVIERDSGFDAPERVAMPPQPPTARSERVAVQQHPSARAPHDSAFARSEDALKPAFNLTDPGITQGGPAENDVFTHFSDTHLAKSSPNMRDPLMPDSVFHVPPTPPHGIELPPGGWEDVDELPTRLAWTETPEALFDPHEAFNYLPVSGFGHEQFAANHAYSIDVPEPTGLGLMCLGLGLMALRSRSSR
ncbi:MAG: PEP-CTERM sorting domain-containing protein [Phycisphaerales bacterium]